MNTGKLSLTEAKQLDMVDYLEKSGHSPVKIKNGDYWYLSPLRIEKTPSFKVNRKLNVWYDHGLQKGGNLIDFGILFFGCSVSELLEKLIQHNFLSFQQQKTPNHPPFHPAGEKEKIVVLDTKNSIRSLSLQQYLLSRKIPLTIAERFCKEVDFRLYDKKYTVLGFPNRSGGYELRSESFKGSSSPKDVTLLTTNTADKILVFEGFFDFLSYQAMHESKVLMMTKQQSDYLILNSIGFMEKMKPFLQKYSFIHLFLDHDSKGLNVTKDLILSDKKYVDESLLYQKHKDLNEYLLKESFEHRQSQRKGLGL